MLGCLGATGVQASAAHSSLAASFELRPGIVVAPEESRLYVMSPEGGIDGIDVASGSVRWSTRLAEKPLLTWNGRLLAQQAYPASSEHVLRLAVLALTGTPTVVRTIEVELPPDVVPRIDDGTDQTFLARARREGSAVLVSWESTQRYAGGAAPGAGDGRSDTTAVGCVRLELEVGEVMTLPAGTCADATPSELPAVVMALARTGAFATPPQRIGDTIAATAVDRDAEPPRAVLRRWNATTAVEAPTIPLGEGKPVAQLASADRRQLLIASRAAPPGYQWAIADLQTGTLVGDLRRPTSAAPFCILGGTLVHTEQPSSQRIDGRWTTRPFRLVALDLSTGAERWIRSLRDTAYRGPMPPRL